MVSFVSNLSVFLKCVSVYMKNWQTSKYILRKHAPPCFWFQPSYLLGEFSLWRSAAPYESIQGYNADPNMSQHILAKWRNAPWANKGNAFVPMVPRQPWCLPKALRATSQTFVGDCTP